LETAELLAIMHDFTIEGIRVGATTALGARYLARADATTVGLFGTGKHARTDLEGIALVRPIRQVKVFSPNPEHRQRFAREMSAQLEIDVTAVDEPEAVVRGVDIVCCATNTNTPVLDGRWLEPGQLVTSIVNSDVVKYRTEVDESTFVRSDLICINDRDSVLANRQRELTEPIERGLFTWEKVHELGDVITGKKAGRERPDDLVLYKNNTGMGIQFAAAGAIVYQEAIKQGVGQQLPSEWFGTDMSAWYEKGYHPSP
jgi:ornithine cyclodeaminase/alanine dehydrogenase-like protein (mu-crystallin family)